MNFASELESKRENFDRTLQANSLQTPLAPNPPIPCIALPIIGIAEAAGAPICIAGIDENAAGAAVCIIGTALSIIMGCIIGTAVSTIVGVAVGTIWTVSTIVGAAIGIIMDGSNSGGTIGNNSCSSSTMGNSTGAGAGPLTRVALFDFFFFFLPPMQAASPPPQSASKQHKARIPRRIQSHRRLLDEFSVVVVGTVVCPPWFAL